MVDIELKQAIVHMEDVWHHLSKAREGLSEISICLNALRAIQEKND